MNATIEACAKIVEDAARGDEPAYVVDLLLRLAARIRELNKENRSGR